MCEKILTKALKPTTVRITRVSATGWTKQESPHEHSTQSFSPFHPRLRPGLTVLELTVVLFVLILLISVLFVGVSAYKTGTDRAACVMNIHSVQNAVRSYSNLNGLVPGQALATSEDLRGELVGPERFLEELSDCPSGGTYSDLGNRIPIAGELYLTCSLAGDRQHVPERVEPW